MIKVITLTNTPERAKPLINSLERFGWDYVLIESPWMGFGTKLLNTYDYLKRNPDIDRFIFVDAHDVVVLGTPEEFEKKLDHPEKMLFNAERGCWPPPVQEYEHLFKKFGHGFNFLNSGVYYSPAKLFIEIIDSAFPLYKSDDQWYFSMQYLFGKWPIELDTNCEVFQCYSFFREGEMEFGYDNGRVQNLLTGTEPVWVHANGGGNMPLVYNLLK